MTDVVFEATAELDLGTPGEQGRDGQPLTTVSMLTVAWVVAGLLFELLRLGIIWHAPVGAAELVHLSGDWTARMGSPDDRFVPTLFQALTTLTLHWTDSEIPGRVLAYLSTATIPFGIFLLRHQLTNAGALLALVLLSLDGLGITMGASASAMGFDLAVTVWLFVLFVHSTPRAWVWAIAGFAVASSGPVALPLVAAWLAVKLWQRAALQWLPILSALVGVVAAVALSTVRYGLGVDGLRIAPFQLFADAYSQAWTTSSTFDLFLIYATPLALAGLVAGAVLVIRLYSEGAAFHRGRAGEHRLLLVVWCGIAFVWLVSSFASHATVSIVALTTPLALLVGPAIVEAATAMVRADWRIARFVVPAVLFVGLFLATAAAGWAHRNNVPGALSIALLAILIAAALAIVWWLRQAPAAAPALWAIPIAIAVIPVVASATGVAFSGVGEPTPSPVSPQQAREVRNILLADLQESGGQLVVHPDLWDELTWPLRDSGTIIISSRVPQTAGAVIWPEDAAKPDGMTALKGQWNALDETLPPTGTLLDYFRWFTQRGTVQTTEQAMSVYVRDGS